MTKNYIFILGLSLAFTSMAQVPVGKYASAPKNVGTLSTVKQKPTTPISTKSTLLWSNDFSTPSDWVMTNTSTPPANWTITTNLNASPEPALNPANFTTGSNGYGIIDSDAQGASGTQNALMTYANAITACSTSSVVVLRFSQTHRRYLETTSVEVSNDNVNWTTFEVNADMAVSTNSANPELVSVNISSVAGNQANVYIRFKYVGAYDWFWAVDDVELVVPDDNDLKAVKKHVGMEGGSGNRLAYYNVPVSQIQPLKIGGIVENVGALTQNDVKVFGTIPSTYSGTSASGTLASFEIDTFDLVPDFTPAGAGNYTINMNCQGAPDANPANNTFTPFTYTVTSNGTYARDALVRDNGAFNQGDGYELGNLFDIFSNETLYSIDVDVHPTSTAGTEMAVKLYVINAGGDFEYKGESDLMVLANNQIGTVVRVPLQTPIPLNAGESYIAVAVYQGGGSGNGLRVGTSGLSPVQTTFLFDIPSTTWFYTTSTSMVRMSFKNNVGLSELEEAVNMNVYPNPATDNATVSFEAATAGEATVSITDLSGKVVYSSLNNFSTGVQHLVIPTSDFQSGVYLVNLSVNGIELTKK